MTGGFDWQHFLFLAKKLAGQDCSVNEPNPESVDRTAIGRAYYAAYNAALDHINAVDSLYFAGDRVTHGEVSGWFLDHGGADKAYKKIGTDLRRLYTERRGADYKKGRRNPCSAYEAIHWAQAIYDRLAEKTRLS